MTRPVRSQTGAREMRSRKTPPVRRLAIGMALVASASPVATLEAQELGAVAGAGAGLVGGFIVTTGIFVAEARTGRFIYSVDDLATFRWEYLPVPVGMATGAVLGARDAELLGRVALGGAIGIAGGAAVGWFVGQALWEGEEGKWAGAVITGAVGMVVGGILAGASFEDAPEPTRSGEPMALHFRVPF
ncbi:MAG: hypothetical protein HKN73_03580 [Gemmatimonadetes bacterium]|nr:hypothetical protein [Gemmatimonadota bacterium]